MNNPILKFTKISQASSLQKQLSTSTSNLDHSNQTSEQRYNNSNQMVSNQSEQRYSGNHMTTNQSEQRYQSSAWDKYGESQKKPQQLTKSFIITLQVLPLLTRPPSFNQDQLLGTGPPQGTCSCLARITTALTTPGRITTLIMRRITITTLTEDTMRMRRGSYKVRFNSILYSYSTLKTFKTY